MSDKAVDALCAMLGSLEIIGLKDNSLHETHCKTLAKHLPYA
jgi:hypothetical protein